MVFEIATSKGKIIGWRLTLGTDCYLIWKDQTSMPGIRVGKAFIPNIGETIKYKSIYVSAL